MFVSEEGVHDDRRAHARLEDLRLHQLGGGLELVIDIRHPIRNNSRVLEDLVAANRERLLRPHVKTPRAVLTPLRDGFIIIGLRVTNMRPPTVPDVWEEVRTKI